MVDVSGRGLEIGPSHAPVFPKRAGFNVEIVDHAPTDELRRKYTAMGVDISAIEEVDYVSDGRPLHEVVPHAHVYDYVFSSHAIEHVTDFVGYLRSCERLLKPGGLIVLAVPDKRYTFDALQPVSSTGRVLEAFARAQSRHSPAAVFDFNVNTVTLNNLGTWGKFDTGVIKFANGPGVGKSEFDEAMRPDGMYQDVHGWFFTPSSFRLIIGDLRDLGLISVDEEEMREIGALEFHVALRVGGRGHGVDRLSLAKNVLYDQVTCGAQVLAAEFPQMQTIHAMLTGQTPAAPPPPGPAPIAPAPVVAEPVKPVVERSAIDRLARRAYRMMKAKGQTSA